MEHMYRVNGLGSRMISTAMDFGRQLFVQLPATLPSRLIPPSPLASQTSGRFRGAVTEDYGTSLISRMHLNWVLEKASEPVMSDLTGLGSNEGNRLTVLIMALYKAQGELYIKALRGMKDEGKLPQGMIDRITVKTLDDSPGDEADVVFCDWVRDTSVGHIGELSHVVLATTRARAVTVHLLERGTFVGYSQQGLRAKVMSDLWHRLSEYEGLSKFCHRFDGCNICHTIGHLTGFRSEASPVPAPGVKCKRPKCEARDTHLTAYCPTRCCRNCFRIGHTGNECVADI